MVAGALQRVRQLLDPRLVVHGSAGIRIARRRFGRILTTQSVYLKKLLRLLIVWLEHVVFLGPFGCDTVRVLHAVEVALPKAEQYPAVELAVAAAEVVQARM